MLLYQSRVLYFMVCIISFSIKDIQEHKDVKDSEKTIFTHEGKGPKQSVICTIVTVIHRIHTMY